MKRAKRGFSLLEVLIAFAVMTIVLTVLLPGQTRFLSRLDPAEDRVLALDYAISLATLAKLEQNSSITNPRFSYRDWSVSQSTRTNDMGRRQLIIRIENKSGDALAELTSILPDDPT